MPGNVEPTEHILWLMCWVQKYTGMQNDLLSYLDSINPNYVTLHSQWFADTNTDKGKRLSLLGCYAVPLGKQFLMFGGTIILQNAETHHIYLNARWGFLLKSALKYWRSSRICIRNAELDCAKPNEGMCCQIVISVDKTESRVSVAVIAHWIVQNYNATCWLTIPKNT